MSGQTKPANEIKVGFYKRLEHLINTESMENGSNTPDFMLTDFMCECLQAANKLINDREKWYGRVNAGPGTADAPIQECIITQDMINAGCVALFNTRGLDSVDVVKKIYQIMCFVSQPITVASGSIIGNVVTSDRVELARFDCLIDLLDFAKKLPEFEPGQLLEIKGLQDGLRAIREARRNALE